MFAMEHHKVNNNVILPDMVTFAKGMGAGLPIGAVVSSQKVTSVLKNNPILGHITTFGGNPVCCASALANIEVLLEKNNKNKTLIELTEDKGLLFRQYLQNNMLEKKSKIRAVRQIGLMMAVQFDNFVQMKDIIDRLITKGFLTDWFLYCDNAMRLAPPLIITEEQIKEACDAIIEICN
jgi:acetylornithine/succinyldiaminopimelate/putrescine aminotransferase